MEEINTTGVKMENCTIIREWLRRRRSGWREEDIETEMLREEVEAAMKELKRNKAERIDSIPAEKLKVYRKEP